jgi:Trypsin-like peptidase domain
MGIRYFVVIVSLLLLPSAFAQDAVPGEILQRTQLIRVGGEKGVEGTAFKIDYKGKLYLVTTRHVVNAMPVLDAEIEVSHSGSWNKYHIARVFFPPSHDVDIAVLETNETISKPYDITIASGSEGPTFGQQVWFLGYPWELHTHVGNGELPFIKRGTMSAIDSTNPKAQVLYIDGFNNPGFSGGPVLYWDFGKHAYRLIAVVQGYRDDHATVLVNGEHVPTPFIINSGILIAYSLIHAIEAIETPGEK